MMMRHMGAFPTPPPARQLYAIRMKALMPKNEKAWPFFRRVERDV